MIIYYLVAECWSARMIVSRQEVRLSVRDREVSQRAFKSARSYLYITYESYYRLFRSYSMNLCSIKMLLLVCGCQ